MAVLIFLTFLLSNFVQNTYAEDTSKVKVLYDLGNPENSVGIIGEKFYQTGDLFENYRVLTFEPEAIVLEDLETRDSRKLLSHAAEDIEDEIVKEARHLFAAKQLKALYKAEVCYLHDQGETYAPDIETLIRFGCLSDGFEDQMKQGYLFRIVEAKKDFQKPPVFKAVAEPSQELGEDLFFYLDNLGDVHFGDSLFSATWGPAWDYANHSVKPISEYIGVETPSES